MTRADRPDPTDRCVCGHIRINHPYGTLTGRCLRCDCQQFTAGAAPQDAEPLEPFKRLLKTWEKQVNDAETRVDRLAAVCIQMFVDELQKALDEAEVGRPARPPQVWQPIETAPKDGTWFWVKRVPEYQDTVTVSAFCWDEKHRGWFAGTGWWPSFPMRFTHWQPMPLLPAASSPPVPGENTEEFPS